MTDFHYNMWTLLAVLCLLVTVFACYAIHVLKGRLHDARIDIDYYREGWTEIAQKYREAIGRAVASEQSLNEKISEIGQLQELLRISKAAVERVENERANCSEGWTKANERVAELEERLQFDPKGGDKIDELESAVDNLQHQLQLATTTAADCAAKNEELASRPVRKYRLAATVATEGKRHDLVLHFADDNGGDVFIPVRSLAASRKNENDLAAVANTINDTIERIIEA